MEVLEIFASQSPIILPIFVFWGVQFILKITVFFKNNLLCYQILQANLIFRELEHLHLIFILIIAFENRKICPEHAFNLKPFVHMLNDFFLINGVLPLVFHMFISYHTKHEGRIHPWAGDIRLGKFLSFQGFLLWTSKILPIRSLQTNGLTTHANASILHICFLIRRKLFHKLYFLEKRIENIDNGANWKEDPYLILSDSQSIH